MANSNQPLVPPHVQAEVKRLYAETDQRGRRVWSYAAIGKALDLSETTVYRIVNNLGAYTSAARIKSDSQLDAEAAASAKRLLELLAAEGKPQEPAKPAEPDPLLPPNPYYTKDKP